MDFGLTKEQEMFKKFVREFVQREIAPLANKIEEDDRIPDELVEKMGRMKLFGVHSDKKYSGAGMGFIEAVIAQEEIAKACGGVGFLVVLTGLPAIVLNRYGNEEQKVKYLTQICTGEGVGSLAFTEAATGSDQKAILTTAKLEGEEYVINGSKRFISGANLNGPIIFFAKDSETPGGSRLSCFIADKNIKGYSTSKAWKKIGLHGVSVCDIYFENMRIPATNLIADHGRGFEILQYFTMTNQVHVCASTVGQCQSAYDEAVKYAKERTVRGAPITQFQTIQVLLADIAIGLEASRSLVQKLAWFLDKGDLQQASIFSPLTRVFVTETANDLARKALRVHGCYGYTEDFKISKILRDLLGGEVIEVTNDIHRISLASRLIA
jgi:alkylation response protein AidB-like acyl-CoA dehydrogenase